MPVDHWNQLQNTCYSNQVGKVESLLETGLSHIDQPTPEGYTPLMLSAERKDLRLARLLLVSKGASLSPASNRDATALMISSQRGFLEVTYLLVEKGADLDAADEDNRGAAFRRGARFAGRGGQLVPPGGSRMVGRRCTWHACTETYGLSRFSWTRGANHGQQMMRYLMVLYTNVFLLM